MREYKLGPYRLDMYIPELRIAIEIDENGHSAYAGADEQTREQHIESHGITLVRFNPDKDYDHPVEHELIRVLFECVRDTYNKRIIV